MNNSLKNVSFHDEKIEYLENKNNDLVIIAPDDLGKKYTFKIKNAKISANSDTNINDIIRRIIINLSHYEFSDKDNYLHLEVFNNNSPFTDEFYIYSNEITIDIE